VNDCEGQGEGESEGEYGARTMKIVSMKIRKMTGGETVVAKQVEVEVELASFPSSRLVGVVLP